MELGLELVVAEVCKQNTESDRSNSIYRKFWDLTCGANGVLSTGGAAPGGLKFVGCVRYSGRLSGIESGNELARTSESKSRFAFRVDDAFEPIRTWISTARQNKVSDERVTFEEFWNPSQRRNARFTSCPAGGIEYRKSDPFKENVTRFDWPGPNSNFANRFNIIRFWGCGAKLKFSDKYKNITSLPTLAPEFLRVTDTAMGVARLVKVRFDLDRVKLDKENSV